MASRISQLDKAQFKGVDILIETVSENGGRKVAIFDYVNSNKIYIDDLGAIPQTFKADIVVHGPNFRYEAEKLTQLLLNPDFGKLVLPVLGTYTAKATEYSKKTENKTIGEVTFSVTFMLQEAAGLTEETISKEQIYQALDNVNDAVYNELLAKYTKPKTRSNSVSIISDYQAFCDTCNNIGKGINGVANQVRKAKNKVNTYINKSETYAKLMTTDGPFGVFMNLIGAGGAYSVMKDLVSWGNNLPERLNSIVNDFTSFMSSSSDGTIPLFSVDFTAEWNDRNDRRILQTLAVRNQAFAIQLASIPDIDIKTSDQIEVIKKEVNNAYSIIFESDNISDYATMTAIDELMLRCNQYLNQKQRDVWKFETDYFSLIASRHLNYMLYNELEEDLEDILIKANDKPFFEGETVILND